MKWVNTCDSDSPQSQNMRFVSKPFSVQSLPPPQALRLSSRDKHEKRVSGDEAQGTMGKKKGKGEAHLARFLLPAFLCEH